LKSALFLVCEQSTRAWAVAVLSAGRRCAFAVYYCR